ncbi:hypothetical protein BB558_002094, partial [Smittium angustum]
MEPSAGGEQKPRKEILSSMSGQKSNKKSDVEKTESSPIVESKPRIKNIPKVFPGTSGAPVFDGK